MPRKNTTNTQILERINGIELERKKKEKIVLLFTIVITIVISLATSIIVSLYVVPGYLKEQDIQKQKGLEFVPDTKEIALSGFDVNYTYNFSGLNYNTDDWTNDVTLSIVYNEIYKVSIRNVTSNPESAIPSIAGNTVMFSWDLIHGKSNNSPGKINAEFIVNLHTDNHIYISTDIPPIAKVNVKDVGEFYVGKEGVVIE